MRLKIPAEVYQFFTNPGGHSLIVRGTAGAGKTTFALQTIEELSPVEWGFYHSTRVSDASLLTQFSWLKEKSNHLVRTDSFSDSNQGDGVKRTGLSDLKGVKNPPMEIAKVGGLAISIGKDLGELEMLYRCIEGNLPAKGLVVIDSIDALADKYNIGCSKLITTIQRDIVEGYGSNVMFVLETSNPEMDYLGDGVVNFSSTEYNRRRLRELEVVKLRGCEIQQPKFIFTLDGGRIQTFSYNHRQSAHPPRGQWKPIPDREERVSCGLGDLDVSLNGGLEKGSITLIELGQGVPTTVSNELESSLVCNFVSLGRGVLWVPMRKASAENARAKIARYLQGTEVDRLVRIPEKADQMTSSIGGCVVPVEGANAFLDFKWQNIEYSLSSAKKPLLTLMGFDTMQSMYGNDVSEQLMDFLALVRRNNGIFVALAPSSSAATGRLADLATTHLKVDRIGGTVLLYGEEPFTECYALNFEEKEAGGDVSLARIL
ncbi:MAG: gas vesicle protein GvpD P-loop domain-containing protein [Methanomassiliicoccus sp.]|nr:gas vesicle protein GvpD P-loop domain-containing protein [Methanomassiliicoccus sp.]